MHGSCQSEIVCDVLFAGSERHIYCDDGVEKHSHECSRCFFNENTRPESSLVRLNEPRHHIFAEHLLANNQKARLPALRREDVAARAGRNTTYDSGKALEDE